MAVDQCRWHYRSGQARFTVSCIAAADEPAITFEVDSQAQPIELLISGEIAAGPSEYDSRPCLDIDERMRRITVRPDPASLLGSKLPGMLFHVVTSTPGTVDAIGGGEVLGDATESQHLPCFAIRTRPTMHFRWTICGSLSGNASCEKYEATVPTWWRRPNEVSPFWNRLTRGVRVRSKDSETAEMLSDTLAWFARDAVIHLNTPRGLEQPNGGAWGVRDVCQGSVEFLMSYDHRQAIADVIRTVFAQQYHRRGDWPQWFMFPPFQEIQARQCHGDVPIWPLKALCDYLEQTDDGSMLQAPVPYTDDETLQQTATSETVVQHADRVLEALGARFLPGVSLPRFGEGDWDDSLQPADPMLRDRMVSSWTTALLYQTLRRFGAALVRYGEDERAARAGRMADDIAMEFRRHLMPDGVVAGFAVFDGLPPRAVEHLLHPRDTRTGLRYRLIPMTRGILSAIFSPEQAHRHLDLVQEHLLFPDGARLMDRPTRYDGGRETTFRRSESAAFFGREIGLQYVHAHLRYAEALAMVGRADELWRALQVVNPIAVTQLVAGAGARQRNCYFSSSDAAFATRYEALRDYEKLRTGEVPTDGGWRIYSSGPGIYTNLVIRHLFGLRRHFEWYEFDPVLPKQLDGVTCELHQGGQRVQYRFFVEQSGCGVKRLVVNRVGLTGTAPIPNPYRRGGVRVQRKVLEQLLTTGENLVDVYL
jgi:cellobiose phosphorylase